jgi:hypothetical protein
MLCLRDLNEIMSLSVTAGVGEGLISRPAGGVPLGRHGVGGARVRLPRA